MLRKVDKSITVYSWNKQADPTDPKYGAFGLSVNKMGMVTAPCYYILEVEHCGETFGLYLPAYEAEMLRDLLGFESALDEDGDMVPLISDVEDDPLDDEAEGNLLPESDEADAAEAEEVSETDDESEADEVESEEETKEETEE